MAAVLVGGRAPVSDGDPDAGFDALDEVRYQKMTEVLVNRLADRSNVVILGRGGAPILAKRDGVFHLGVVCPARARIERMMKRELCDEHEARERVRGADARDERIFRDYFQTGFCDPVNYDLVVNTAHLSARDAVSVVHQAIVSSLKRRH